MIVIFMIINANFLKLAIVQALLIENGKFLISGKKQGKDCTLVYSNDGSAPSGVGNFVVQSVTINGVQRALPTLRIFTELRESLAELEKFITKIISASTG